MANIGDIQHNLKTGADSELYFSQVVTTKSSSDYGKIISKLGRYRYPFLSRMTGESIKGSNETLESNELKKGKVPSKKKLGNEMSEGSLDVEFSPTTFDDLIAAALMGKWKPWVSDKNSDINLDKIHCNNGEFLTRAIVSLGKDDYGNWGATYNTKEIFEPRKLLNDGEVGNEDGLISVPKGCVIHELCCGSDDIKFDVLRHLGGHEDEDLYQRYKNLAVNTMSVDVQIGSIVTGSFSFMGSNNPIRVDESNIRKEYGSDESKQFVSEGVTGNSFIDSLPDKSTDTDQFTSMEGNLWVNGKNITTGTSLSMEINNNLERKNAIFVKKAISTTSPRLDISGSLGSYVVFGETEELANLAAQNKTNEIMFMLQDKEVNPEFLYLFQIFESSFETPDAGSGQDAIEDSYSYSSFNERALRILRITLPKPAGIEFAGAENWTETGSITIIPNAELSSADDLSSYSVKSTLKKADGTEVATQTITSGATVVDGCLVVFEEAFTDTTDGEIREIEVIFNDKSDYSLKRTFEKDVTAPAEVSNLTANVNNSKIAISWTDPVGDDLKELAVTVTHEVEGQPVEDIYEKVNRGVQAYTTRRLLAGTYSIKVQAVDGSGNKSTGETVEAVIS